MSSLTKPSSRPNVDDRRDATATAFMSGTLPPKVPETFDPLLRKALSMVLAQWAPSELYGSHQFRGTDRDRAAGARFASRRLTTAPSPDRVIVTNGTHGALTMLIAGLCGPGEVLALEELSYPPVKVFADRLGVQLCPVPMDREGLIPEALEASCQDRSPRALYCMPTLQNPSTAVMSHDRREQIAAICRRYRVSIIEDDVYSLLPLGAPAALSAYAPELSWHILGTAKGIAAGLKIAYVVAPTAAAAKQRFWPGVRATHWMAAPINAAVSTALIETGAVDQIIGAVRSEIRERRDLLVERLHSAQLRSEPECPHVWLRLPDDRDRREFIDQVRSLGAEIGSGDQFALGTSPAPNAVRIGIGGPPREVYERGVTAIARGLAGPPKRPVPR